MKKSVIIIGTSIVIFASLLVILKKSSPKIIPPQNEFRFHVTTEPPSLDWTLATDHVSHDFINNIMEGLIQYNDKLQPIPALAEKWEISEDGKRYTFHLQKNVQWSDGQPLLAQHFVDSWERLLNPKTASEYAYFLYDITNAQNYNSGQVKDFKQVGIKAEDSHTLSIELSHPAAYFLAINAFWVTYPIRIDIIEKHKDKWTEPKNIVTLGPFLLKEWEHDYRIILEKNPYYYGSQPGVEKITAYIINEDATALSLYETGKIDILRKIPPTVISKYKNREDYKTAPYLREYYYGFNTKKKPFDDVKVRRAVSMAIDRSQFSTILGGNQIATTSWVPKGMMGYEPDMGLKFNPTEAKKLLTEAGYPNGKGFPIFQLVYDSRDDNKIIAENLQQQLKEVLNVEITIINQEWKIHLKQLEIDPPQFWRLGWGADFPDPDNFLNLFTSYSGNNKTKWSNPEYDRLIAEGAKEFNLQKRLDIYRRAQKILTEEDVPIVPLFIEALNYLIRPYVKGYRMDAMSLHILKNVKIEK